MRYLGVKKFFVKWTNYEYWPWFIFYLPVIPVHIWYSIKSGNFFFNTSVNPGIDKGGLFGESKISILNNFTDDYKPKTLIHIKGANIEETIAHLKSRNFEIPLIIKPNIGERGAMVSKIYNLFEIESIINKNNHLDFIIQEFIDYPIELGVLYGRLPGKEKGEISSITIKKFLSVIGDGKSTVYQLLLKNKRAWFQLNRLETEQPKLLIKIPDFDESIIVEPIGNHCRGTEFVNANHLINENITAVFDIISKQFEGFYYGRFDLKTKSIEEFESGKSIKIFELNGVTSEPGHIYDHKYKLYQAYLDIFSQIRFIYQISKANKIKGIKPLKASYMFKLLFQHFFK